MKLYFSIFFFTAGISAAQSFHRGALVLEAQSGFEIFHTTSAYHIVQGPSSSDTTITDAAGNANLSLGIEVGILKRWGIGLRGKTNSFFTNLDNITHQRADIHSTDLLLLVNFHPVTIRNFDLVVGSDIGFSAISMTTNDRDNTLVKGNGSFLAIYLNPRLYFGRIGINLKTYLPAVNYRNLQANDRKAGQFVISSWKGSGAGISLGVQLRLFNP
jgi:hypothetical protein